MAHNDDTEQPQVNTQVVIATLGLLLMTSTATVYRTGIHRRKRRRRKHPNKPRLRPHRRTLGKYLLAARRCGKARTQTTHEVFGNESTAENIDAGNCVTKQSSPNKW